MKSDIKTYLDECVLAIQNNNPFMWPSYQDQHVEIWKYIARSIGHGLVIYTDKEVKNEIDSLYSRILVKNTFNTRIGVPVDASTFLGWIREARAGKEWVRPCAVEKGEEGDEEPIGVPHQEEAIARMQEELPSIIQSSFL